jgi:5-formyltetrahydrofolate cyclo-ligase
MSQPVVAPNDSPVLLRSAKQQLRRRMRALRGAVPSSARALRSAKIVAKLLSLPEIGSAKGVASFWPILEKHEVDLRSLDSELRMRGVHLYYPFMDPTEDGYRTGFRLVDDTASLRERGRGFAEPDRSAAEARRGDLDVVLVPALAAAETGQRLGYGIGFYDSTLPDVAPPARTVIVAFGFQLLAELPHDDDDFGCDVVVTDERISVVRERSG